ncbi:MFS transporter [Hydrotalea sandarakina]|jgi:MFS family permease|uniref:Putative MFS family arabinose efflux permease n=1 Tax=Hydrotalea sandarakina TaxID=1004304 RepID=A0A2W7RSR1_9BACT|nr:MFS transporter [Hydrotalea sandarakina]PZX63743.1 putative MFS family arabinose efflux permease [Hydrotalea sandarakina]
MNQKQYGILSLPVIVGALGYFVDIYDLLLFSIIRVPSLKSFGLTDAAIAEDGLFILNIQMIGLLLGGILWGVLGDKKGRLKVLFASIILYSLGNIANGFVQTVNQYALVRFISGIGLAGELGAGITLVSELLPKEKRGIGTSLVAGIGLTGAVFAFFIKEEFEWRTCYFIGGGLGLLLLLLRVGVLESGMFQSLQNKNVRKGDFFMLFSSRKYFFKYIKAILIGLPTWYVIGILISFSKEFGAHMRIQGNIDPGKAVMYAYVAISIGDILVGFLSQLLKSRKQAVLIFYGITALSMIWYFNLYDSNVNMLYLVSAILGFGTGFWAIFVTMAAEQFGTNIRATVATTVPNMVRGSLVLVSLLFTALQTYAGYVTSAWITGIVVMIIALLALLFTEETFHKDLNYVE